MRILHIYIYIYIYIICKYVVYETYTYTYSLTYIVTNLHNQNWFYLTIPSTTAQSCDESFKYTKPTGKFGCCESQTAERTHWWTGRWLELFSLEWLQRFQWSPGQSPHPQLQDAAWCSAAAVVVVEYWNCSCGVASLVSCSCSCMCDGVVSVV